MTDKPLKDVIKGVVSGIEEKGKNQQCVLKAWEGIVGDLAARHTKVVSLRGGRIVVKVSDSTLLYKLSLDKDKLLRELNENLKGKKGIKEVRFRIGKIE
jgi:predicted nucleic acid-binding Zn ribbon protein